jgi:hypothetical protein
MIPLTKNSRVSRRRFLACAGATLAMPTFVPFSAWGSEERPAPSARINMGMVGCGGMQGTDGFRVLEWLRFQPGLRRLLVVVFTASQEQKDINRAFDLGANSYIVKPVGFDKLQEIVRYLGNYWLNVTQCPECVPDL